MSPQTESPATMVAGPNLSSLDNSQISENPSFLQAVIWIRQRFPMTEQRARITAELARIGGEV